MFLIPAKPLRGKNKFEREISLGKFFLISENKYRRKFAYIHGRLMWFFLRFTELVN